MFRVFQMPPKKVEEPERKPLIGRVGTNLRVGIVGVPNVGKSTFFNVLTKSAAPAENFPFCTIDPNESRVPVPDARFDYLVNYHKPARWAELNDLLYLCTNSIGILFLFAAKCRHSSISSILPVWWRVLPKVKVLAMLSSRTLVPVMLSSICVVCIHVENVVVAYLFYDR